MTTTKVRNRFQPTVESEVDEGQLRELEQQGLLFGGTDEELAALHEAAGLPAPKAAVAPAKPAGAPASASTTTAKEG